MDKKIIRFTDEKYYTLFEILDGDSIELHYSDGDTATRECHFIDEYHTKVGRNVYHIHQFGEIMARNGTFCKPTEEALLNYCKERFACVEQAMLKITKHYQSDYYKHDTSRLYTDLMAIKDSNRNLAYVFIARDCGTQLIPFSELVKVTDTDVYGRCNTEVSPVYDYYKADAEKGTAKYYVININRTATTLKPIKDINQFIENVKKDVVHEYELTHSLDEVDMDM